jgi:hypothetical protein
MGATINTRIQLKRDTTTNWDAARGFVPMAGEVIVYTDYSSYQKEVNGQIKTILIPGIKIGDGNAYVQDLPFVDEDLRDILMEHIRDMDLHVTLGEKAFWNNKINVDDAYEAVHDELIDEMLVLNRN